MQTTVAIHVHAEKAPGNQLAKHRSPLAIVHFGADAEGTDGVVAKSPHALVALTQQNIDEIVHPEALIGTVHAGERLAGGLGTVPRVDGLQAGVAVAAGCLHHLVEVGEQNLAPAAGHLAVAEHRLQLAPFDPLVLLVGLGSFEHLPETDDVGQAVDHPGIGGKAVASGAPRFLVVGFDALG